MDNTQRFSNRVEDYTKYRPSYPAEMLEYITDSFQLSTKKVVADIGSGTGKFTDLLLPVCGKVYAVEPNTEMRKESESRLQRNKNYVSVDGSAERTTLKSGSIDVITVAQAFHWFDLEKTKEEFERILKLDGPVAIIANKRVFTTDFLQEYERMLRENIPEYAKVNHYNISENTVRAFLQSNFQKKIFTCTQTFDWLGLVGRFCSSSYTPSKGTKEYIAIEEELKKIFTMYNRDGHVDFIYETVVQTGKIN